MTAFAGQDISLTGKPQPLSSYFKQLFAQVTNPPIDCIREEIITSTETAIGSEHNLLKATPEHARLIELKSPILTNEEFAKLKHIELPGFKSVTIPILFKVADGAPGLEKAMDDVFGKVSQAIQDGINVVVLSDRGVNKDLGADPVAAGGRGRASPPDPRRHPHPRGTGPRIRGPREIHQYSLLIGYGCGAINPYLAFETLDDMVRQGLLTGIDHKTACKNYLKAAMKGVVKVLSKMGISTIQSYWGAQIFEAVGLQQSFIDKYFTGTPSRIEGWASRSLPRKSCSATRTPSRTARSTAICLTPAVNTSGARTGNTTCSIRRPSTSCRRRCGTGSDKVFKEYSTLVNEQNRHWCTLRGLLDFKKVKPVPLEEVESVESILKRFKSGAMSYGSISKEAHETLAIAMNRIGGKSNTGEGGEDPERYVPLRNGDSQEQRHQAGRVRAVRRHQPLSGQRQRAADQDGPGRQARRRRPVARSESLSLDRQSPLRHAGRGPDLAAPAP